MSLEINEIGIRMRVEDGETGDEEGAGGSSGGDFDPCGDVDRQRLVADCVRQVLAVLDRRQER